MASVVVLDGQALLTLPILPLIEVQERKSEMCYTSRLACFRVDERKEQLYKVGLLCVSWRIHVDLGNTLPQQVLGGIARSVGRGVQDF